MKADESPAEVNPPAAGEAHSLAVVVIGRNEGERLRRCLESVEPRADLVVYVDSGSTDDSVEMALARGALVVNLDMTLPFTAARARNAGFRRAREKLPEADYVQFVDGDCEVDADWIHEASKFLDGRTDVAAVTGRRRERFPDRSVYNWLCDLDWQWPAGQVLAFGGDVLIRVGALEQVGGYRDDLIAGEEPELCVRLRAQGWKIWNLPRNMTAHDANMMRFSQWWKRTTRTGFAYAEGAHLHGAPPERHWVRETRSGWIWGAIVPLMILAALPIAGPYALLGLLIYPLQILRLTIRLSGTPWRRLVRSWFIVLGKFPQALGQLKFLTSQAIGRKAGLIEYK